MLEERRGRIREQAVDEKGKPFVCDLIMTRCNREKKKKKRIHQVHDRENFIAAVMSTT
tara:strand:- start:84 stop:257 length:174 start_codon:yes stop_codon:yes gene_type:complete